MKTLCVVDTCSLIYMSDIELGNRPLQRWLLYEFDVFYSEAVWNEILTNRDKIHEMDTALWARGRGRERIWQLPTITTVENELFDPSLHNRNLETGKCRTCNRPFYERKSYALDLMQERDQGERHNCCVALHAVMTSRYQQVLFLTDDYHAIRDYVEPVFQSYPLGNIWSSQDLILHLFMRHNKYISHESALNAIQDTIAKATQPMLTQAPTKKTDATKRKWSKRRIDYVRKLDSANQLLNRLGGLTR